MKKSGIGFGFLIFGMTAEASEPLADLSGNFYSGRAVWCGGNLIHASSDGSYQKLNDHSIDVYIDLKADSSIRKQVTLNFRNNYLAKFDIFIDSKKLDSQQENQLNYGLQLIEPVLYQAGENNELRAVAVGATGVGRLNPAVSFFNVKSEAINPEIENARLKNGYLADGTAKALLLTCQWIPKR